MRTSIALALCIAAASPCLAGGEPYYMPPQYQGAPPVTVYAAPARGRGSCLRLDANWHRRLSYSKRSIAGSRLPCRRSRRNGMPGTSSGQSIVPSARIGGDA
jgi:hypothetical protein